MGYYSTIRGEITFDPPASWNEIRALSDKERLFRFRIESEEVDTDEGTLTKRQSRVIEPTYDEQVKAYSLEKDFQAFLNVLEGRSFSGEFWIEGEAAADVHRLFVHDGKIVHWVARLTWPDGSSAPGRG